ncbi:hypothetical protein MAPG_09368 [Magnaporthiopsis poae ATCC 64411]|uniref:Uncharacterized protein n=1 Tax=Magnaporthiopsis poae (strain ATCC 64411 / 73-15) TaxID=644358 RepID=A0A0C4E9S1_MAGP6|nr:hypothetical protein MAPG_09368 [Magnaporthiopsis poae ATCC 64411]
MEPGIMSSEPIIQTYYELSWAILSTIGLTNVLFGLVIVSITSVSPATLVPILVSAAGAVANGLCYAAYYHTYDPTPAAVAAGLADVMWLLQEAGMSMYSYVMLTRVLTGRARSLFMALFWTVMSTVAVARFLILGAHVSIFTSGPGPHAHRADVNTLRFINHLHVGYFVGIAVLECLSAFFLLRIFAAGSRGGGGDATTVGVFRHFVRSTEFRVASLALIGTSRAVTYFFQPALEAATTTASQIDRFIYTLECLFPVMLYIDILSSRLALNARGAASSPMVINNNNNNKPSKCGHFSCLASPTRLPLRQLEDGRFNVWQDEPNVSTTATGISAEHDLEAEETGLVSPVTPQRPVPAHRQSQVLTASRKIDPGSYPDASPEDGMQGRQAPKEFY